jgi:putative membrane protein
MIPKVQFTIDSRKEHKLMMGGSWMHGFGGFGLMGGIIGLLFNLAILIGFVWLVVWAIKRFTSGATTGSPSSGYQSARELLQARYARGEITREQYQQMLQDIS